MICKVLLRRRLHRNFTIPKQCLFAVQRGVINTNEVHNIVLQCDVNLNKLEGVMTVREGRVRFDSEVSQIWQWGGKRGGPEDDSGDPHGRGSGMTQWRSHWEPGLVAVFASSPWEQSQVWVRNIKWIALSSMNSGGSFTSFLWRANWMAAKWWHLLSTNRGVGRAAEGGHTYQVSMVDNDGVGSRATRSRPNTGEKKVSPTCGPVWSPWPCSTLTYLVHVIQPFGNRFWVASAQVPEGRLHGAPVINFDEYCRCEEHSITHWVVHNYMCTRARTRLTWHCGQSHSAHAGRWTRNISDRNCQASCDWKRI